MRKSKQRKIRGTIIYKKAPRNNVAILLLAILQETTLLTADIVDLMLAQHTHIHPKVKSILEKKSAYRRKLLTAKFEKVKNKQRIYTLLYKLRKQGFISKIPDGGQAAWHTTQRGFNKFLSENIVYLPNSKQFQSRSSKNLTVVIYDIPVESNELRYWLRETLINMGFKLLQKSVWIGDKELPQEFIDKLTEFELLPDQVKIFRVIDEGSI